MATRTLSMSRLYRKYKPQILSLLNDIKRELEEEGYQMGEPFEMSDEEYMWTMQGGPVGCNLDDLDDPDETCFSIDMTINESKFHNEDDAFGVNFSSKLIGYEGEIIGGLTPYNYSDRVWVSRKDPDAVQERWELFQDGCDPCKIVSLIQEHYAEKQTT